MGKNKVLIERNKARCVYHRYAEVLEENQSLIDFTQEEIEDDYVIAEEGFFCEGEVIGVTDSIKNKMQFKARARRDLKYFICFSKTQNDNQEYSFIQIDEDSFLMMPCKNHNVVSDVERDSYNQYLEKNILGPTVLIVSELYQ